MRRASSFFVVSCLAGSVALAQNATPPIPVHEIPPVEEMDIKNIEDVPVQEIVELPQAGEEVYLEEVNPEASAFPLGNMPQNSSHKRALLRILTFSNNDLHDAVLTAQQPYEFQGLTFILRGCRADVNNQPDNDMAWVDIYGQQEVAPSIRAEENTQEIPRAPKQGPQLLSGWLLNQYTDAHTLEHSKYDVRLVACR